MANMKEIPGGKCTTHARDNCAARSVIKCIDCLNFGASLERTAISTCKRLAAQLGLDDFEAKIESGDPVTKLEALLELLTKIKPPKGTSGAN